MNMDLPKLTNPPGSDAWQAARTHYRGCEPPEALEAALLAKFDQRQVATESEQDDVASPPAALGRRWSRRFHWPLTIARPAWIAAVASVLAASVSALWWHFASVSNETTTPFMLVSESSGKEMDVSQLVRVNVSREAMLDFGIPVPPQRLQEPVRAEVLLGREGNMLAVRFVEPARRKFFSVKP